MALPITVPYTFGNATTAIPLSNLDSDYATVYQAVNGIGNGSVALANVTITGGTVSNVSGVVPTPFTANGVVYASSTSALATGSALVFDGTNLGLGVTPTGTSKFEVYTGAGAFNGITARFNSSNAPIAFGLANSNGFPYLGFNTIQANGLDTQTYSVNNFASRLDANGGGFKFLIAPSGTAGNAISFTQAMTLDVSGRLAIGSTSVTNGTAFGGGGQVNVAKLASSGYPCLQISTTSGGGSSVQFTNSDTVNGVIGYNASGSVNEFTVNNTLSGALTFATNNTERARIDTSGNLLVGQTSVGIVAGTGFSLYKTTGIFGQNHNTANVGGDYFTVFGYNGSIIGSITQAGTTGVLYNVTSDQRLKENIVDAPEFGGVIDSIKVRSYDWKSDQTHQRAGFIAQELVTVAPEAVHQPVDPDDMMAVDYSKLVPMLVKEIQSLRKRILTLENK